jgi:hypothetical protein
MNLVEQAARLIDPDAFAEVIGYDGTGPDAKPVDHGPVERARRDLHRSTAVCRATEVLRLALAVGHEALRDGLVAAERDGWERLGLPAAVLDSPAVAAILRGKYDPARLRAEDACQRVDAVTGGVPPGGAGPW